MGFNPILYPTDYPQQGDLSAESALASTVGQIQVQAITTAIRNAANRRISMENDIANRNRVVNSFNYRMPRTRVGQQQAPPQTLRGTNAFVGGGREYNGVIAKSMTRFGFSGENTTPLGVYLSRPSTYMATFGNASAGFFAGGSFPGGFSTQIDQLSYPTLSCQSTGLNLATGKHGACGIGNHLAGIVIGGLSPTIAYTQSADKITYGQPLSISNLGNSLIVGRYAPHNGTSNPTNGFIYGGSLDIYNWANLLTSIENFTFATNTVSAVTATLSSAHAVHAAMGSALKGYVAGGVSAPGVTNFTATIDAFTYSGQTTALLGSQLSEARICCDGVGSSLAGYVIGGDTPTSILNGWTGSTKIERLDYGTETVSLIGATLPQSGADQGGVSDYGAGFVF